MCEAERRLKMAAYEIDLQRGTGEWNLARIQQILTAEHENCTADNG